MEEMNYLCNSKFAEIGTMKIIKLKVIPKQWCCCFVGVIWCGDKSWIDSKVINHERIHLRQQQELLFIPFYIIYVLEWLMHLFILHDAHKAYLAISHEREAYKNEGNMKYLEHRKHFAQFHKQ